MFCDTILDESAASFCCQVAAWVPDVFCNFYFVKNPRIARNSAATDTNEKNKCKFGLLKILEKSAMNVRLHFKTIHFYLIEFSTDLY
jgi:hypothetical protein